MDDATKAVITNGTLSGLGSGVGYLTAPEWFSEWWR